MVFDSEFNLEAPVNLGKVVTRSVLPEATVTLLQSKDSLSGLPCVVSRPANSEFGGWWVVRAQPAGFERG